MASSLASAKQNLLSIKQKIVQFRQSDIAMTSQEKKTFIKKIEQQINDLRKGKPREGEFAEKRKTPKERERVFTQNITEVEIFLDDQFVIAEEALSKFEVKLKKGLTAGYNSAETRIKDGVEVLNRRGNSAVATSMKQFTKKLSKKLEDQLLSDRVIGKLFGTMGRMAISTLEDNRKLLAEEFVIDRGAFNSFTKGYRSNITAFLFNEPRRVIENIEANFGAELSKGLALEQVGTIKFNRNTYKLSLVSHPRAAFKDAIFDNSQRQGFTFWKKVVPKNKISRLSPSGETAASLFLIMTAAQWNQRAQESVTSQVNNLGAHHGDFSYFYPILSEELEEEEAIARAQREKLKTQLE